MKEKFGLDIIAWTSSVGNIECKLSDSEINNLTREQVDQSIVRCPNLVIAKEMENHILELKEKGDSIGGID